MLDFIMTVLHWVVDNPTIIAAFITAVPALFAAWWARTAKQETQPNHGKSLRDAVDQISERQVTLMKNDTLDREQLHKVKDEVNEVKEEVDTVKEISKEDRTLLHKVSKVVLPNNT